MTSLSVSLSEAKKELSAYKKYSYDFMDGVSSPKSTTTDLKNLEFQDEEGLSYQLLNLRLKENIECD